MAGFTDHDRRLMLDGTTFEPDHGLAASEARRSLGLAVDTQDIEGALSSQLIHDDDILAGLYDGAKVETLLVNWRKPTDFVLLRTAKVGRIVRSDGRFVAELESRSHALDQPSGRHVSRACDAELGDARCGFLLDQPGFTAGGVVEAVPLRDTLAVSGMDTFDAGWFAHGILTWTSGAAAGRSDRVEAHRVAAGEVKLVLQPGNRATPLPGDTFGITAGCDRAFATCREKFSNALNFRGFPHLPGNDAAYAYPIDGDAFDGTPLVP